MDGVQVWAEGAFGWVGLLGVALGSVACCTLSVALEGLGVVLHIDDRYW